MIGTYYDRFRWVGLLKLFVKVKKKNTGNISLGILGAYFIIIFDYRKTSSLMYFLMKKRAKDSNWSPETKEEEKINNYKTLEN